MAAGDRAADDALKESWEIQSAASSLGFDWPDAGGVLDKLSEELQELRVAWEAGDTAHAQRELGDLLLASVNLARFLETDPAGELRRANERFSRRFEGVKKHIAARGRSMETCTLAELDAVWEEVKAVVDEGLNGSP